MMNVWVKTHHDGLIRAACIIRIDNDGAALRVWHRAGGDAAVSSVKVCKVPDLTSELPDNFAEQLAAAIAFESDDNMAVLEAVHGPAGWYWKTAGYAHIDELRQARTANEPPKQPELPTDDPLNKRPQPAARARATGSRAFHAHVRGRIPVSGVAKIRTR